MSGITSSPCWAGLDGEAQCQNTSYKACFIQPALFHTHWKDTNNTRTITHSKLTHRYIHTLFSLCLLLNSKQQDERFPSIFSSRVQLFPAETPWSAQTQVLPMWGSRCRSTPYRFPGNLRTHSRHPWCRSPCHRDSCSRRPGRRCSSSSSKPLMCMRRTRPGPPPCCKASGTHKKGRPRCSERSSPLVKELSVTPWNCLCCAGCCHCWLTSWTSIFSASSVTQAWTAASWAALSLAWPPLLLCQGLTHPWCSCWCWRRRCMSAWRRVRQRQDGFRCRYSAWVCQRCHGETHYGLWQRLPQQAPRARAWNQTEAELLRARDN